MSSIGNFALNVFALSTVKNIDSDGIYVSVHFFINTFIWDKFFKGYLPQNLLIPLLNALSDFR